MKKNIHLPAWMLILCLLVYGSCKKNEPDAPFRFTYPPAPPKPAMPQMHFSNKTIRGIVLEYGSDIPIAGANLEIHAFSDSNSMNFYDRHLTSDSLGKIQFDAHEFQPVSISQTGYWDNQWIQYPGFASEFFPGNTTFDDIGITCDSFVLRLVPMATITVHLRDSSKSIDFDKLAEGNVFVSFNFSGIQPYTYQSGLSTINIYKGIDTTFKFSAFGNSENKLLVASYSEFDLEDTIKQRDIYIAKGSNPSVNITF
jgi:hypothetical protein